MCFPGFSRLVYTPAQYDKSSIKHNTMIIAMLTFLMLFFMVKPTNYLNSTDKEKQKLLHGADYSGMVYAVLESADAYIRPKYTHITLFDKLSIMGGYSGLLCLMEVIFGEVALILLAVSTVVLVTIFFALGYHYGEECNNPCGIQLRDKLTREFIVVLAASDDPAAKNALATVAFFAVFTNSDDPTTKVIVEAVPCLRSTLLHLVPNTTSGANSTEAHFCFGCCA